MLEFQDNKKRKIIEETCLEPFCNEVVQILELKVCRETYESLHHYWKAIEEATTAKWGEDSRVTKCLKTKGPFNSGFDPQSFQYARVAEKIEAAKIKCLQEKENERLRAERKAKKEEEQRNYHLRKEEEQKQKGEYTKEGNILVPFLKREVPRWKFISMVAGIPSLIALATSIPIVMLNKSSETEIPDNMYISEDIGKEKEIAEVPTGESKSEDRSSIPQPGQTSVEGQPPQQTVQHPASDLRNKKWEVGPQGPYGVQEVGKSAGESPKIEVPPKTPSTYIERPVAESPIKGHWGYVKKKRRVETGKRERVWVPERIEGNRRIEGHYEQKWVPGGYWEEYTEKVWIPPESTERRLIDGRWYKKRYIEDSPGSGQYKEVWALE